MTHSNFIINPPLIAHRGASLFAPENTVSAFRKAKMLGINWVEFDVMLTLDDEIVVIHDETLDRTTNGVGHVCDCTYDYLRNLDAGSWFDSKFSEERISTLEEIIELLNELNLCANIEIKAQKNKEDFIVKKVLSVVKQFWKNKKNPPLISSFSLSILEKVKKYSDTSLIGFLMDEWNNEWEIICDRLGCAAIDVNHAILNSDNVKLLKATNRKVLAYTVNNLDTARTLFSWGVDAVFTDNPAGILNGLTK